MGEGYLFLNKSGLRIAELWLETGVDVNSDNTAETTRRTCFGVEPKQGVSDSSNEYNAEAIKSMTTLITCLKFRDRVELSRDLTSETLFPP